MAPKRSATKSLAGGTAKRLRVHDLKKKPADPVGEELFASDEPVAEADVMIWKKTRNLPHKLMVMI